MEHPGLIPVECALLHCLWAGSAFPFAILVRFSQAHSSQCTSKIIEDIDHELWACPTYSQGHLQLFLKLRTAGWPHHMTEIRVSTNRDFSENLVSLEMSGNFHRNWHRSGKFSLSSFETQQKTSVVRRACGWLSLQTATNFSRKSSENSLLLLELEQHDVRSYGIPLSY